MKNMFTPFHIHDDYGFGAIGDAFETAADKLESVVSNRGPVMNENLPFLYLRRHAIESFMKSAIIIIHKCTTTPYGSHPASGKPYIHNGKRWVPIDSIHSLKKLWVYMKSLFLDKAAFLESFSDVNWAFPVEMETWIETIEQYDSSSTYFRYPNLKDPSEDVAKSTMVKTSLDEINTMLNDDPQHKQIVLIIQNDDGEITDIYRHNADALADLSNALKECIKFISGIHFALQMNVYD